MEGTKLAIAKDIANFEDIIEMQNHLSLEGELWRSSSPVPLLK